MSAGRKHKLSIVFPVHNEQSNLEVLIGALVLNEAVPPLRILGVGLIMVGVVAVSVSQ